MPRNEERSVSDVLQDIFGNLQDIVRSEIRLAKAEVKTEAGKAASAGKPLAVAALLAFYGGGLLLLTLVYALSLVVQPWLAAAIVCALVLITAGILASVGRQRLKTVNPKPEKTIDSLKENVQWLKDQSR